MEKGRHQQKLAMSQLESSARFDNPTLTENQPLPPLRERPADHRPLLERRLHTHCYFAGGRTNIPSAVSWITGIASFGSKTP